MSYKGSGKDKNDYSSGMIRILINEGLDMDIGKLKGESRTIYESLPGDAKKKLQKYLDVLRKANELISKKKEFEKLPKREKYDFGICLGPRSKMKP